ncbi:hypothetical protein SAMN05443252_104310 [Bacillus sp. OV322]|nr:hypothetical protein [Bacillus sp. OV322]SFC56032.1 hypothetical protein SAMN05443252_104310 [Bacillus sp. OV322]
MTKSKGLLDAKVDPLTSLLFNAKPLKKVISSSKKISHDSRSWLHLPVFI